MMRYLLTLLFIIQTFALQAIDDGIGKSDITPLIETPSAAYLNRNGEGMVGKHDSLLACSFFIPNGV